MKLNYYQSSLTIISIVLTPLAAFAEVKPESITKADNNITQFSIKDDIKGKNSLVKKLIQSKQLTKSQQEIQKNAVISTSAADLDINKPDLSQTSEYFTNHH